MADDETKTEAKEGKLKAILAWLKAKWVQLKNWALQPRVFLLGFVWCLLLPLCIILLVDGDFIKDHLGFWFNKQSVISPIVSLFAFFVATFGLFLAGRRTQELSRQNDIALKQNEVAIEQNKIVEQGQLTERFARAIEQLGHERQEVRMGGLYVLGRVAETSPAERSQAIEILAGFVRSRAAIEYKEGKKDRKGNPIPDTSKPRSEKIDIETAIKILADIVKNDERLIKNKNKNKTYPFYILTTDLRPVDLSATDLRDLQFEGQNLSDFNFKNALLSDKNTPINLFRANLSGADLSGANLTDANLTAANLIRANLSRANLIRANLFFANLTFAPLVEANLSGANLTDAELTDAELYSADLANAALNGANLSGCDLFFVKNLKQEQLEDIRYKRDNPPNMPARLKLPNKDGNFLNLDGLNRRGD